MHRKRLLSFPALALAAVLGGSAMSPAPAVAQSAPASARNSIETAHGWTAGWSTAPQRPSASFFPNWSEEGFADHTVRQVVRVSSGGQAVRVRLTNAYGTRPVKVTGATIARSAGGAAVRRDTVRHLTVKGSRSFTIAAGAELAGDPVPFRTKALEHLTITLYLASPTGPATYHAQSLATSFRATGDHRSDAGADAFTETSQSWYYLSGLDVTGGPARRGVVAFGDSITDGTGSGLDADGRYPDELAERLLRIGRARPVLNQGIGGNRVTIPSAWLGDSAVSRFRRDVLGRPGAGTVIILEGINDIGISEVAAGSPFPIFAPYTEVSARQVIAGHRELIRQARAGGLRVIGATLPPVGGSAYYTARAEAKRDQVNAWIRTSGEYDAVVDFDRALADPADQDKLAPAYDSGDHLHPSEAGYRAMAEAVDPTELR